MIGNFHTHSTFSDGKNTPEEIIECAIEKGFSSLGFSDHGITEFDIRYCMRDTQGYLAEIRRLQKKYAGKIQIYLGTEEDISRPVNRDDYDYLISSSHYIYFNGKHYPFDSTYEYYTTCLQLFNGDALALARSYYQTFCDYLMQRKPDVIGHFDLITKFDESKQDYLLHDERYWEIAENAVKQALQTGSIFELNTGLMIRGYRTTPCPHERLLKIIAQNGGKITLSSDSHHINHLDGYFEEMKTLLKSVGFDGVYVLLDGKWQKTKL